MKNEDDLKIEFNNFYLEAKQLFPNITKNHQLFPRMILKSITINDLNLTDDEIEDALCNLGSHDEGIDAFYKDSNNDLHFFQFKSKNDLNKIKVNNVQSDVYKLVHSIDNLKQDKYIKNTRLADIKEEIMEHPNSKLFFYYYTQDIMEKEKIKSYEDMYENLFVFDLNLITEKYNEYISNFLEPLESLNIEIDQCIEVHKDNNNKAYILILNGYEIYKLMNEKKFQLFKNNVRFYLGDNQPVNRKIIETATKNPQNFFNFNNGITIEATEVIDLSNNQISLKNPSIINGAQTVNCIHSAYKNLFNSKTIKEEHLYGEGLKEHFKKIKVLAKLTIVNSTIDEYSMNLSKNVNSQNTIKEADYFSNLDEQIQLKRELGKKYNLFYEIKRGEITYFRARKNDKEALTEKTLKEFSKKHLKLQELNRNYIAIFENPSSSFHSANNMFKKKDNHYESIIQTELNNNFNIMTRKLIFSQFLSDLIKEELYLYNKFYQSLYDLNFSNEEKINLLHKTGFLYKNELIKNINNLNDFEDNYVNLNIPLINKGKYVYGYFINYFINHLKDDITLFDIIINSNFIHNYDIFKKNLIPYIYHISEILQSYLKEILNKGKNENQLAMNFSDHIVDCEDLIKEEIKKINRNKIIDKYMLIQEND